MEESPAQVGLFPFLAVALRLLPVLVLAVLAVYWPGLSGSFVFDDQPNIVGNPSLRVFDGSLSSLVEASGLGLASPLGRPLSLASFAANLHFWGESAFHFKLVNLLIHLFNGLLVYLLVRRLWRKLVKHDRAEWAALWVAAVWLLHPINLTPVLYVVQRMTALATFFTLAALVLYLHGRQSAGLKRQFAVLLALLLCWPAGIMSKESALLLPVFVVLCEWLVVGGFDAWGSRLRVVVLSATALACAGLLAAAWPVIDGTYQFRDFTPAERLLTQARVLWLYVSQIMIPLPDHFTLHHDDIAVSRGLFDPPTTALAVLGWVVAIGIAILQRRQRPWITFGVLWFLAGHLLESSIIGLEIAYEHRNYLPSLGVIFGVGAMLSSACPNRAGIAPRLALGIGALALCGVVTGLRAAQWGNEYVRTQIEANANPTSARTHFDAARAILERQLPTGVLSTSAYAMARTHFLRAAQYDPHDKAALAGVLYLDCAIGANRDSEVRQRLLGRLAHERFSYGEQGFIQNLSDMLVHDLMCMDSKEVDALLAAALSNPTATGRTRGMLHAVAMDYAAAKLGSLPLARKHALAAVESDPGNAVLRINLIRVLLQLDEVDEAKRQYVSLARLRVPAANRMEVESLRLRLGI